MKRKLLLCTDILLLAAFIVIAVTGVMLYVGYHVWSVHLYTSMAFTLLLVFHLWQHRGFYKKLRPTFKGVEVWITDLLCVVELVTGYALYIFYLSGHRHHSPLWGEIHWICGLIMIALILPHALTRLKSVLRLL